MGKTGRACIDQVWTHTNAWLLSFGGLMVARVISRPTRAKFPWILPFACVTFHVFAPRLLPRKIWSYEYRTIID